MEWIWSLFCATVAFGAAVVVGLVLPRRPTAEQQRMQRQLYDLHERLQKLESERSSPEALPAPEEAPSDDLPSPELADASRPAPDASTVPVAPSPHDTVTDEAPSEAAPTPTPEPEAPVAAARPTPTPRPRLSPEKVAVWLGASLGAVALAIGALLGIVAAAEAGWLGPGLRIGAGLTAGTVAWVLGAALRGRSQVTASGLSAAGASAVFGATWAATSLYHFLPAPLGFGLLLLVVAMAMAQASRFRDRFLGVLATLGGLLASSIIRPDDPTLRVGYGLVLSTGIALLASRRRWPELLPLVAAGVGLQLVGWTATARAPDHQATALLGIVLLSLPYAAVAARVRDPLTQWAATLSAMAFPVLAAPWIPPIDPVFYDPRTGLVEARAPVGAWAAAVGLLALPAPLWLAGRLRRSPWTVLAGSVALLPAVFAFGAGWTEATWLRATMPVAVLGVGLVLCTADRRAGRGLLPMAVVGLFPLVATAPSGPALLAMVAFTAMVTAGAWTSASSALTALGLPVLAVTALRAADAPSTEPLTVFAALAACTGLFVLPTLRRWDDDAAPWLPWAAAVVAPAALFPALYRSWDAGIGDGVVGLLPLFLAGLVLLQGAVLVRVHRTPRESAMFATVVIVALAGITLALPLQLEERWLTVGLSVEAAALAALSRRLRHPLVRGTAVVLSLVVAVRLLVNPWALEWGSADGLPLLNWTLYTWGVPTASLVYVARRLRSGDDHPVAGAAASLLQLLAMFTGFALVNVEVSHAFQSGTSLTLSGTTMLQGMVRSLAWGGYGMLLLVVGLVIRQRTTRFVGFGFVLLAAVKVFVVDLWSLPGFIRVGSLLGLGVFLIVAAFLFERLVLRERPLTRGD